jgi:hypothetical protein
MLQLWSMSKTWKCKPSEILHLTDELAAYCLNRAVYFFGTAYDADITEASTPPPGGKGRRNPSQAVAMANHRWLTDNIDAEEDTSDFEVIVDKKYRDPAVRFTRG